MPKKTSHKDVEFIVDDEHFKRLEEALVVAGTLSLALGEKHVGIYVLVHSEAGAKWWAGDEGVERYRSDPNASVFEKLSLKIASEGMIA